MGSKASGTIRSNPRLCQVIMIWFQCWNRRKFHTYLNHQVPLQDIHHVHFDLEDLAFQDVKGEIVLGNGSDAKTGSGSDDFFELIRILPMKPCLPVVTRSLLAHHDNPFSKASKGDYAVSFPEKVVGNNGKQESCALTVTGAIIKLSASRKSAAMDIKTFASVSHVHSFGKCMSIVSTHGEHFSAVYGYHELAEHTDLASFQFDPGGHLSRGFLFDPRGFMRFLKSFPVACLVLITWKNGDQSVIYYLCNASNMYRYG